MHFWIAALLNPRSIRHRRSATPRQLAQLRFSASATLPKRLSRAYPRMGEERLRRIRRRRARLWRDGLRRTESGACPFSAHFTSGLNVSKTSVVIAVSVARQRQYGRRDNSRKPQTRKYLGSMPCRRQ
jgi:hypothetical protein